MEQMQLALGPFLLQQPIGRGGMSEVWRAQHQVLGLPVAIKILMTQSPVLQQAFAGEVRAMARLDHPGIVAVLDQGIVDHVAEIASGGHLPSGTPWMAMELCSGGTLEGFIPANFNGLRRLLMDLLIALSVAHARGVLHLDLKPENVLISNNSDLRPGRKLTDFGLSFAQQTDDDAAVLGTPAYMAPEQFRRQWRDYGPWTDLYALGCVGWALCTGQPPFGLNRPPEVLMMAHEELPPPRLKPRIAVPEGVERWLRRLLEKKPEHRFPTAWDALMELHRADGDRVPPNRVPERWQVEPRPDLRLLSLSMYGLRSLPVAGRVNERQELWDQLRRVESSGQPAVVVLHGHSGVGKSRLVSWLCERSGEMGASTHLQLDAEGGIPGMLARHFRCEGLERDAVTARLAQHLPGVDPYEQEILAAILFGDEVSASERYAVLRRFLARLCRIPLILWMEDAWTTPDALDLVDRLLQAEEALPVLVLITAEREALLENQPAAARLTAVTRGFRCIWLEVPGLSNPEMDWLLTEHLRISPDLAQRLRHRANGNPSFAVQVVNDWVQRGILEPQPSGLVLKPGAVASLPDDMQAVWAARLDRILEAAHLDVYASRRVLELAAIFGETVPEEDWLATARALDLAVDEQLLPKLLAAKVVKRQDGSFAFVHPMLRECLERESEEAGRLRSLRLAVVQRLQKHVDRPGFPERLALQLISLGLEGEAQRALLQAAHQYLRLGDRGTAINLLDRATELLPKVPPEDPRHAEGELLRARLLHSEGRYEEARLSADKAATLARQRGWSELLSESLTELADLTRHRGSPSLALELFQEAHELHKRSGDRMGLGVCLVGLGELASQFGELGQALRLLQQALTIFSDLGQRRKQADTLRELADTARRAGKLDQAAGWAEEALLLYRNPTVPSGLASATNIQAAVHRQGGRLFQAESLALRSLQMFEALDSRQVVFPLCNLGLIYAQLERFEKSEELLLQALNVLQHQGRLVLEAAVHAMLLPALSAREDWVAWDQHFQRAARLAEDTDTVDPDIAESLTLSARRLRDSRRAVAAWEMARSQWLSLGFQSRVAEANAALVRVG